MERNLISPFVCSFYLATNKTELIILNNKDKLGPQKQNKIKTFELTARFCAIKVDNESLIK
jgi:hypothetical protein